MSTPGGILGAGTLVSGKVASTTLFLDDSVAPQLNVAHQWVGGTVNLSAGSNPAQGFTVQPVALSNSQLFTGPNANFSNTLTVPGTATIAIANVGTALNVVGPSSLTGNVLITGPTSITGNTTVSGSFLATGSTVIGNTLSVGNTINVPTLNANLVNVRGPQANLYVETSSALSSNTSALYLSPVWRMKILTNNGLAFQYLYNGTWVNQQVIAPVGLVGGISALTSVLI